jgi:hypothetical protein
MIFILSRLFSTANDEFHKRIRGKLCFILFKELLEIRLPPICGRCRLTYLSDVLQSWARDAEIKPGSWVSKIFMTD